MGAFNVLANKTEERERKKLSLENCVFKKQKYWLKVLEDFFVFRCVLASL